MTKVFYFVILIGAFVGCGDSSESGIITPSTPSSIVISEENYSQGILGIWYYYSEPYINFSSDGTAHYTDWNTTYQWLISGSQLSITDTDGNLTSEYPYEIESMSDTELIYIQAIDKIDGDGIIQERVILTR